MTNYNINFLCYTDVGLNNVDTVGFVRYSASDVIVNGAITKYAYRLHDNTNGPPNGTGYANHEICFILATSTWDDLGALDPVDVDPVPNTNVIKITYGGGALKYFDNPWPSGSGTGSEGTGTGSTTPAGTIQQSQSTIIYTVASTSPSSSGVITYELLLDGVLQLTVPHTYGTTTTLSSSFATGLWVLRLVSTTGLTQSQTLATFGSTASRKKVFCNFW